jgi:PadR family transcriptional regulator PadR
VIDCSCRSACGRSGGRTHTKRTEDVTAANGGAMDCANDVVLRCRRSRVSRRLLPRCRCRHRGEMTAVAHLDYNEVQMAAAANLGELEQLMLLAILRLRDNAYGVTIRAELAERAGRTVAPGALYTALERLETKGLISSRMSDPTPQRGGRAKRHVTITTAGMDALTRALNAYERLLDGLNLRRGAHAQ